MPCDIPLGLEDETATRLIADERIGEFHLTMRAYPRSSILPPHVHRSAYFTFVLGGGFVQTDDDGRRTYTHGTAAVHPAGAHHADAIGAAGARDLNVHLPDAWNDVDETACVTAKDYDFARLSATLLREIAAPDAVSPLVIESVLLETLAMMRRRASDKSSVPVWFAAALRIIESRFREDIRLATIADEIAIHPVHLAKTFRQHTGVSIGERIRALRISAACRMLTETPEPIVDIAAACGFADQSHLTRMFARHVGTTPRQYRRAHRR